MDSGANRGQSTIIAVVLLVGIAAVGSAAVLLVGGSATGQTQERVEDERIQQAFLHLDNRIDTVSRSKDGQAVVDLDLPDDSQGAVREEAAGRMVISRVNVTTGKADVLVDRELGAIVYDQGDTHVAYQAGGVWRGTGNRSRMVSPPSVSYAVNKGGDEPTLTVPLPAASGANRLTGGEVRITKDETVSPVNDVTIVEGDLVVVAIESEYYVAWADYFETITNARAIELDHANETAVVEMIVPATTPTLEGGVIVGAASETLKLKQDSVVDSYNSSKGPYATSSTNTTRVVAAGDVNLKQNTTIRGSLEVDGNLDVKQDARITGNLRYNTSSNRNFQNGADTHVLGWRAPNASVNGRPEMDGVIDRNVALIRENNHNNGSVNVSSGTVQGCSTGTGGCKLYSGNYFLDEIDLDDSDKLILDTRDGSVNIAVLDEIDLDGGRIKVVGDGRVNVYLDAESGSEDFSMKQDAKVTVPDDRAPYFWLYMDSDAQAKLRQESEFTGVIYGPGEGGAPGTEITMSSTSDQIHVYGAVVGDVEPITQEVKVHYDEALAQSAAVRTAIAIPRVTFLHVSVDKVTLDDE